MFTPPTDAAQPCPAASSQSETASAAITDKHGAGSLPPASPTPGDDEPGDVLYGAKAIARFLFGADGRREQRRVFNLWSHYQHRKERVGFFKLKGAVCLSKSQWRSFQG